MGECRGEEALDRLTAMNTGHDGSLSTGHANSCRDMLSRLETMVIMAKDLPLEAIRNQIASGVDIIVQLGRLRDKSRRVLEIAELDGVKNGEIQLRILYRFQEEIGKSTRERVSGKLKKVAELKYTDKLLSAGLIAE